MRPGFFPSRSSHTTLFDLQLSQVAKANGRRARSLCYPANLCWRAGDPTIETCLLGPTQDGTRIAPRNCAPVSRDGFLPRWRVGNCG